MLAGLALIAAPIVPRESSHQLLRVLNLDVVEEVLSLGAAQHCGLRVVVSDDHLAPANDVLESLGPRHALRLGEGHRRPRSFMPHVPDPYGGRTGAIQPKGEPAHPTFGRSESSLRADEPAFNSRDRGGTTH